MVVVLAASPTVTITGTYLITVVFTETTSGSAMSTVFLPILLLPFLAIRKRWCRQGMWLTALFAIALAIGLSTLGCGGSGKSSTSQAMTASGTVTLNIK